MTFTKKQMKVLEKYEKQFQTAIDVDYCRIIPNMIDEVDEVYKEAIGNSSGLKGGCNRCTLNAIKKIGKLYFKDKAETNNKKKKTDN